MLAAAKVADWDQVAQYETVCAVLINELRGRGRTDSLQPDERREKSAIMRSILINDAKIRALAEPWLDQYDAPSICVEQRVLH